jgi:hypothetical protein
MVALSGLRMVDGQTPSGEPVEVLIGRAVSGRIVIEVRGSVVEFDTDAAAGVIVAVGEAIRGRSVHSGGDGS